MSRTGKPPPSPPPGLDAARKARQAEALRRNLARRKQQARGRAARADSAARDAVSDTGTDDQV